MISTLIFLLGTDADAPIVWGKVADGRLADHGILPTAAALSEFADDFVGAETVVAVLQGEDVAARILAAPPKGERRMIEAARYLMEDELAETVDALHVACAPSAAGARVAAVRTSIVDSWLALFRAAGVELNLLLVDFLALPSGADTGTIVLRDHRAIAAFDGRGFAAEKTLVCGERWQDFFGAERRFALLADVAEQRTLPFRARTDHAGAADDQNLLLMFAKAAGDPERLDLLQGRFRRRTAWRTVAAPWRRAAVLCVCAGLAGLLAVLSDGAKQMRVAEKWSTAAKTVHSRAFPDVPAAQAVENARRRLAQGSGDTFARVTAIVGKAASGAETVEVSRIRYDAAGSEYFVSVRSVTDQDIEAFKNRLIAGGVSASDNGGYRRVGEVWAGELIVRAQ